MADEEDFSSDTSDDDYVPSDGGDDVSEASGDEEDLDQLAKDGEDGSPLKSRVKKSKQAKTSEGFVRKRKGGIKLEDDKEEPKNETTDEYNKELQEQIKKEQEAKKEEEEKKKSDSLWASFMSDVGPTKPKPRTSTGPGLGSLTSMVKTPSSSPKTTSTVAKAKSEDSVSSSSNKPGSSKITITKEYDFAGETVSITKEVDANSKEAKAEMKKQEEGETPPKPAFAVGGIKRPGGGLGGVLGMIGKKPKLGTLEKSKLDWDNFKKDEGIDDELKIHNRGKEGFLERKAFLERADVRQFEIERNLRLTTSKR